MTTQRAAVGRTIVVVVVALVLVVGVVSALYLPRVLYPSKIMTVGVGMSSNYLTLISKFTPKNITVVIGVNNTVQWTNNDQYPTPIYHTVTEGKPVVVPVTTNKCSIPVKGTLGPFQCPTATPFFDSGNIQKNGTFTYTFTTPGVYEYFCVYHPGMVGFVIVKQ